MRFSVGGGKVRNLIADDAKKDQAIAAFAAIASVKPVAPQSRFRHTDANAADAKNATSDPKLPARQASQ